MVRQDDNARKKILIPIILLTALVFISDALLPLGYAVWLLYLIPLLLSGQLLKRGSSYYVAAFLTALVIAGLFIGPAAVELHIALFNRAANIAALLVIAVLLERYKTIAGLRALNEELARARDIAERRAREAEEGRWILDGIMTHVPEAIQAIAPDHAILRDSRYSEQLTGHPKEDLQGLTVEERIRREPFYNQDGVTLARSEELPAIRALQNGEIIKGEEWKVKTIRGEMLDISINAGPLRDGKGSLIGAVTTWQDITGKKKAAEALRQSEQRYSALFNAQVNGIAHCRTIVDEHGKPFDYEIMQINDAYTRITGIKKEDIEGKTARQVFPGIEHFSFDYIGNYGKVALEGGELNFEVFFEATKQWHTIYTYQPKRGEFTTIFTDITERKNAEEQRERLLKDREEQQARLQTILNVLPVGVWVADADGRIIMVNDAATSIYGGKAPKAERVEEYSVYMIFRPDTGERIPVEDYPLPRALRGETVNDMVIEHERFDGSRGTHLASSRPIKDSHGTIAGAVVIAIDITERRKTEEALRKNEERFRALVNASSEVLYQMSPDWREMLQLSSMAFLARTEKPNPNWLPEYIPEEDREIVTAAISKAIREKGMFQLVHRVKQADGNIGWTFSRAVPLIDSEGNIIEWFGAVSDITERKKVEEALRESQTLLDAFFNNTPAALVIYTDDNKFFRVNRYVAQLYGLSMSEMTGKSIDEVLSSELIKATKERNREVIATKQMSSAEIYSAKMPPHSPEAKTRSWQGVRFPVPLPGGKTGVGVVSFDITERIQAEESLRESREDLARAQAVAHIGSWRLNTRRNELMWSDEVYRIFGVPTGTPLTYETFLSYVHPDDRKYLDLQWEAALKGEPYDIEHRIVAEGNVKWVREKAYLEFDKNGALLGGFGTVQDITDRKKAEEAVRVREAQLNAFFESSPGILNLTDENICLINTDRITPAYFGLTRETIKGKCVKDLAPRFMEQYGSMMRRVIETGVTNRDVETQRPVPDRPGEITYWRSSYFRVPLGGGKWGLGVVGLDVTDIKKAEDTLRRNEYEMRTLVDNSPDLIFRMNRQMQYIYANPAYEQLAGMPKDQLAGKANRELGMSTRLVELWQSAVQEVIKSGREYSVEFDLAGFFGKRYFIAQLVPEFAKSGLVETVLVIARDITERKRAEDQVRYISFHDEVTGLFNRAFFEEELRRVDTERDLPISIIMGDVNNLKLSNDVFGHDEGDKLLKTIAESIRKACRQSDIVARWGGDEFSVILPRTDFATANGICGRIKQVAKEAKGTVIEPGVALGIATKDNRDQNIYQTIRQAEEGMYQNKLDESRQNEDCAYESLFERARERNEDIDAHIERSYSLADRFGRELELSESQMDDLRLLVKVHDIGDAVIPHDILAKPGRLSEQEWGIMKKHAEAGFRIVKTFADTSRISDEVFSHGERWDGTGYPRGLKEKEIPYLARVLQILDAFDVMTHPRPYARTFTQEEAIEELRRNAGKQFDPELTEAFIKVLTGAAKEKALV